ncbi:ATP-binding protein [Candidatus Uabimicrobium amorphum]|uniref:ATPase AAA n=1 Tax=Uabimicrobium amorphum TaxID=2596890 RepID=A0A5S9F6S1_UABAM|nr:ATP-binding protein [Candidatus Uabimicrobium amorphum]BBM87998.1 ATPase AAA [Candidatus Uabimicrobium amorphum]
MSNLTMYESNYQCVRDHLQYINLVLAKLLLTREESSKGLYISQEEVWNVMDNIEKVVECENTQLISSIDEAYSIIQSRIQASLRKGCNFPFLKLYSLFELDEDEIFIVSLLLAGHTNPKYKTVFAYLNNDLNQKFATVELLLDAVSHNHEERFRKQCYFRRSAPLLSHRVIQIQDECVSLTDRFKDWLCEVDCVEKDIENIVEIHKRGDDLHNARAMQIFADKTAMTWLTGIDTNEKIRWIHCQHPQIEEIVVGDLDAILSHKDLYDVLDLAFREALLRESCLFFRNGSTLHEHPQSSMILRFIEKKLRTGKCQLYVCGENRGSFGMQSHHVAMPPLEERKQIWMLFAKNEISQNKINKLAEKYSLSFSQIENIYKEWCRSGKSLEVICKEFLAPKKSHYIQFIDPHYKWKDIVLPKDKKQELKEISKCIEHKDFVLDEWNFQSKVAGKRGINIVFSGGPGTGKTMTADIIAGSNNMNLYKVDTASIVDKYIGETEKKLRTVFEQVSDTNSILFFDEADSLFGKRGEVERAQDRYANVTVSYLLQKIEDHNGIVILATNLIENLDKAFVRRMNFVIQFPHPTIKQRVGIWKKIFPREVPVDNIDLEFLAKKVDLSGGYIKNIAWLACFYAAEDDKVLRMSHIIRSVRREYQKIGKAFLDSDFAPYV